MASKRSTLKAAPRADFGSRTSRRMRRDGLVPGVVYSGGSEAKPFQVERTRGAQHHSARAPPSSTSRSTAAKPIPVVIKEEQLHPVRGSLQHIDLQQVRLDEEIQAEVAIELEGVEDAPGVKGGGVLEHVTREITVEALPTDIPDNIVVDVSAMEINDTLQLSAVTAPEGVTFVADDPEEVTIVTLSPPRVEEVEPEVEEEAELVGEGEGEARPPRARAATPARARASSSCRCSAAATAASRATASSSSASATPGPSTSAPATTSASRSASELAERWQLPKPKQKFNGRDLRRADRARGARGWRCCSRAPT